MLKAVEPLRQKSDTVVREDLESSENVVEPDAPLRKMDKQAKAKLRRQKTEKETELANALLGTMQLRGRVQNEVKEFIKGFRHRTRCGNLRRAIGRGADRWRSNRIARCKRGRRGLRRFRGDLHRTRLERENPAACKPQGHPPCRSAGMKAVRSQDLRHP